MCSSVTPGTSSVGWQWGLLAARLQGSARDEFHLFNDRVPIRLIQVHIVIDQGLVVLIPVRDIACSHSTEEFSIENPSCKLLVCCFTPTISLFWLELKGRILSNCPAVLEMLTELIDPVSEIAVFQFVLKPESDFAVQTNNRPDECVRLISEDIARK